MFLSSTTLLDTPLSTIFSQILDVLQETLTEYTNQSKSEK